MNDRKFEFDLAISFAGEQRQLAEAFASRLDAAGYAIFYDDYYRARLLGIELAVELKRVYSDAARYCLILLSQEYIRKQWTNFERQNAISRLIRERSGYVLCLKIDAIELPGFPDGIGYASFGEYGLEGFYKVLLEKLGPPDHVENASNLGERDRSLAQQIIAACYRRAIYTRMDSEIDVFSMYDSIGRAIGKLQDIVPQIVDHALQFTCNEIIVELDSIERTKQHAPSRISNFHPQKNRIDAHKFKVVKLLLEIRRKASIPMQLLNALSKEHYFDDQADKPPS
jgi:hypothetical protein